MDPTTCSHVDCPLRDACLEIGAIAILPDRCIECIDRQVSGLEQAARILDDDIASLSRSIGILQGGIDACHRETRDLLARAERNLERSKAVMAGLDAIDGKLALLGNPMDQEMASTRMAARSALADLASSIEVARQSFKINNASVVQLV